MKTGNLELRKAILSPVITKDMYIAMIPGVEFGSNIFIAIKKIKVVITQLEILAKKLLRIRLNFLQFKDF